MAPFEKGSKHENGKAASKFSGQTCLLEVSLAETSTSWQGLTYAQCHYLMIAKI